MRNAGFLTALVLIAGCTPRWAQKGEHTLTIDLPATVNRGEKLVFTVMAKDSSGRSVHRLAYQWTVTWVGLEGIGHKGKTGMPEKINVKGSPGTAKLRIETLEGENDYIVIATKEFQVQ